MGVGALANAPLSLDRESFMRAALAEAETAGLAGELPIGVVLASRGEIVARADPDRLPDLAPTATVGDVEPVGVGPKTAPIDAAPARGDRSCRLLV